MTDPKDCEDDACECPDESCDGCFGCMDWSVSDGYDPIVNGWGWIEDEDETKE